MTDTTGQRHEACRSCGRGLLIVAGELACVVRTCKLYGRPQPTAERTGDEREGGK